MCSADYDRGHGVYIYVYILYMVLSTGRGGASPLSSPAPPAKLGYYLQHLAGVGLDCIRGDIQIPQNQKMFWEDISPTPYIVVVSQFIHCI